jgi:hypothetical protein
MSYAVVAKFPVEILDKAVKGVYPTRKKTSRPARDPLVDRRNGRSYFNSL